MRNARSRKVSASVTASGTSVQPAISFAGSALAVRRETPSISIAACPAAASTMTPPRNERSGLDICHHHFAPPATLQPSLTNRISLGKLLLQQPKGPLFLGALDLAGQRAGGGGGLGLGEQNGFFQPADFAGHD